MHKLFTEIRGEKYKREHYELCTYNYSDSCEMILLGDTDKELMMDIKDLFFSDTPHLTATGQNQLYMNVSSAASA